MSYTQGVRDKVQLFNLIFSVIPTKNSIKWDAFLPDSMYNTIQFILNVSQSFYEAHKKRGSLL